MNPPELLEQIGKNELFSLLEIEIVEAAKERVVLKMPVTARVHQYVGIMNGGISLLLAESAASIGAVLNNVSSG